MSKVQLSDVNFLDFDYPPLRGIERLDILLEESVGELEEHENNAVDLMAILDEPQESEVGDESHVY